MPSVSIAACTVSAMNSMVCTSQHHQQPHRRPHRRRKQLREPVPYIERLQIAVQQHHRPFALQRIAHPDRATAGHDEFLFLNHIRPSTDKAVSLRNGLHYPSIRKLPVTLPTPLRHRSNRRPTPFWIGTATCPPRRPHRTRNNAPDHPSSRARVSYFCANRPNRTGSRPVSGHP